MSLVNSITAAALCLSNVFRHVRSHLVSDLTGILPMAGGHCSELRHTLCLSIASVLDVLPVLLQRPCKGANGERCGHHTGEHPYLLTKRP